MVDPENPDCEPVAEDNTNDPPRESATGPNGQALTVDDTNDPPGESTAGPNGQALAFSYVSEDLISRVYPGGETLELMCL